ncbi:hypothetical protein [Fulvivirga kasyanovii]|uniref:Uncharacterized protein n=1 Tax=Fulvivirga kasyanovii TaxID=396812 RepID=A0ABW9RHD7_9BACT|nr:hypothetical protein [Fulvivirga kasyanovii]MTI23462.1 hypothetical protein [Fulvivirga kasyanovii]
MKKIISTCFILLNFYFLTQAQNSENLYTLCLKKHLSEYMVDIGAKILGRRVIGITDALPDTLLNFQIQYVGDDEIESRAKKEGFSIIMVSPIINDKNLLYLNIWDCAVNRKKKLTNYIRMGGSFYTIGYVNDELTIVDEHHGGL